VSSVDANPRRASLRLTAAGRRVCRYRDIRGGIERELSAAGFDARELATFRQCLDKLELQLEKRIRAYNWDKVLNDCSGSALAVVHHFRTGAIRTIGLLWTNGAS
jgi:hypothetical protein